MEMMLEVVMGVINMEDDKLADMILMIPNEDFSDDGDTYGDDVWGNDVGAGHEGWQGGAIWWLIFWLM